MNSLKQLVADLSVAEARAAFYYTNRYLKLAPLKDSYEREMFEDDARSVPSETVKLASLAIIQIIEKTEGMHAAQFDKQRYRHWIDRIAQVESGLEPQPTPEEEQNAAAFLESLTIPTGERRQAKRS
jgi:hypothetical protein